MFLVREIRWGRRPLTILELIIATTTGRELAVIQSNSTGDAGKFHVVAGTPFLITPYRYENLFR